MSLHSATLRYFVKVAELGSIRRAADVLNVASSAVNRQILGLERDLGFPLFRRDSKGVVLTSAGKLLLQHARDTVAGYQRTIDEIVSQTGELKGSVRITGLGSFVYAVLPDTLASLLQAHPGVSFQVTDDSPAGVIEALKSGHADVGIAFLDRRHKDLELCASINTRIAAIMRADHPLAGRHAVSFSECCAHDIALFSGRLATATIIEAEFQETGAELKPRIISNAMAVIRTAILKGGTISFQTPVGFIEEIARGDMVAVALERSELSPSGVGLFTVQGSLTSPVVRAVIDRCIDLFAALQLKLDSLAAPNSPGPARPGATRRAGRRPPVKPKAALPKRARRHESLE